MSGMSPLLVLAALVACLHAARVPLQKCSIGRHTIYANNQKAGACMYNADGTNLVTGPMAPGFFEIAALNDYTVDGFGWQASQSCGVCYEVTGISGRPVLLMVTDYCPDCPTLQAHFDMSAEAASVVDTPGNSNGGGFTAVTYRRVSCGFTGNIRAQIANVSNAGGFTRLQISRHNVQLGPVITVQGTGGAAMNVTRTTFGVFDWTLVGTFPVNVTVYSIFGDQVKFTLPALTLNWAVVDTGGQFPDPPAGINNAQPGCAQCSSPAINNGQAVIYDEGPRFPGQTGEWVPLTSAAWMWFGTNFTASSAPPLFQGAAYGSVAIAQWGEVHIGCNVGTPKAQVTAVTFAARVTSGTAQLAIWSGGGAHTTLSPLVSTTWTRYTYNISSNGNVPEPFNDLQIQTNTAATFNFDDFKFVLAPNTDACTPWLAPPPAATTVASTATSTTTATRASTTVATTLRSTTAAALPTVASTSSGATVASTTATTRASTTATTRASTTTARVTAAPGGSTTPAAAVVTSTTAAAATSAPQPAACSPAVPVSDAPKNGGVPCPQCCFNTPGTQVPWGLKLDVDYDTFDCPTWLAALATQLGGPVRVCGQVRGSWSGGLEVATAQAAAADALVNGLSAGNAVVAGQRALSGTTTAGTGVVATSTTAGSNTLPIIIGVVVAVVVLAAIAIVIVVLVVRKRRHNATAYVPLRSQSMEERSDYTAFYAVGATATPAPAASANAVTVRILSNVDAVDNTILRARAGDVASIDVADWDTRGDWVWATVGAQQGYVPSSFCERIK